MPQALKNGQIEDVDDEEVDFEIPDTTSLFSTNGNSIPLQNAVQSTRQFYGSRFINQAQPLERAEAPLVRAAASDGRSFDDILGDLSGNVRADDDLEILDVQPKFLSVKGTDGKKRKIDLYDNFVFNRKSGLSNVPRVQVGQRVKKGDLLARSNYTDDNGTMAMGINANIIMAPYKGHTMDDAVAISEEFAKKLTSEHMGRYDQEFRDGVKGGQHHFISLFPQAYTKEQLANIDDNGVVKPGTVLKPGDPMVLATKPRTFSSSQLGSLSRSARTMRKDVSQKWEGYTDGVVTDVVPTRNGYSVVVKSYRPALEGDKIVLRNGNKGLVSRVIPQDRMPRTESGMVADVLLNPYGMPSRANVSTPYEILLGKVAKKTGKPYVLPGFNPKDKDWHAFVSEELEKAGVSDQERVYDPEENRWLDQPVMTGNAYILKLHHTAECYDDRTEVLTQDGWKLWKDVAITDKLATSDTSGKCLRFELPLHLVSYDYDGFLCSFSGKYVDYAVTPNHNMWQKPYYGQRTYSFAQASVVHGRRFKVKQFGMIPECPGGPDTIRIGTLNFDWDDFCEFTGWWVAEGCVGSNGVSVLVYQSSTANPERVRAIEELIKRMGVRWSHYKVGGVVMGFAVNEKDLAVYFSEFGKLSQHKSVPRELMLGRLSGCRRLRDAMMLGDGSPGDGYEGRYTTTSKQLADEFQELCVRLGEGSIVRKESRDSKKYRDNPHFLDVWNCSLTTTRNNSQVDGDRAEGSFSMFRYSGKVFCAEMASGLLYVRRNGKPMLCGNSKVSSRGQAGYDDWQQPSKGGDEGAKRLSGLETNAMLSSGAYANIREGATLRGQKNDNFWSQWRQGLDPAKPGEPFVWRKFRTILSGMGMRTKDLGNGKIRLGPYTEKDLDREQPVEITASEMLNLNTLEPTRGGLFDPALAAADKWGYVRLPRPMVNPAFEEPVRKLLGLTRKQYAALMRGDKPAEQDEEP